MKKHQFYRSAAVPIELRIAKDSTSCYAKHTHEEFSVGAVDSGCSRYFNNNDEYIIQKGSTVVINPLEVHACNPMPDTHWSYKMMYVCPIWLGEIQSMLFNQDSDKFVPFSMHHIEKIDIYTQFQALAGSIIAQSDNLEVEEASIAFFSQLFLLSNPMQVNKLPPKMNIALAYDFVRENYRKNISIKDIANITALSEYHVIHAFRRNYGITPHAMQITLRINEAKKLLKQGMSIVSVAAELGFHDQSHFHRNFKKRVAVTPAEYK